MRVRCEVPECGRVYDDAKCWTICPHRSLDVGPTVPEDKPRYFTGGVNRQPRHYTDEMIREMPVGEMTMQTMQEVRAAEGMLRYVYKFRTQEPYDRDVVYLILSRYAYDDRTSKIVAQQYLNAAGEWIDYQGYEQWQSVPEMDGMEMDTRRKQMAAFVKQVQDIIDSHNATNIKPMPKLDLWGQICLILDRHGA